MPDSTDATNHKTREAVLGAACQLFAEHGYHETTIAQICGRAGANIAAVNYYFGSKEALYVEAWERALADSLAAYPPDGGVPADAPPAERLRGRVRSVIERIADHDCLEFDLMHKEMANPTGLLTESVRESIGPLREKMTATLRELLGPSVPDRDVQLCLMSIMSQCFGPMLRMRHHRKTPEGKGLPPPPLTDVSPEDMADHVVRFSLAGLADVRHRAEERGGS